MLRQGEAGRVIYINPFSLGAARNFGGAIPAGRPGPCRA